MAEMKEAKPQVEEVQATVKETVSTDSSKDMFAIGALVLGVINLCSWCLPFCGCPLSIIGIVLGVLGMKSEKYKTIAMIGLVISVIALLLAIANGAAGLLFSDWDYSYNNRL